MKRQLSTFSTFYFCIKKIIIYDAFSDFIYTIFMLTLKKKSLICLYYYKLTQFVKDNNKRNMYVIWINKTQQLHFTYIDNFLFFIISVCFRIYLIPGFHYKLTV